MSIFQDFLRLATIPAVTLVVGASSATAQEGGATTTEAPTTYWAPSTTTSTTQQPRLAIPPARAVATRHIPKQFAVAKTAHSPSQVKTHRLILQVNTNDPAAMNLALNNAMNVTQHFKKLGEKVNIEVITFGPGLHMVRNDTSPEKAPNEEMALSTPEVSFKACGNTQENMQKAENKEIPIIPQAKVVVSGVVRVMELQEKGWSYVKP
jgi:intracellular sulfur oxidation DsrE/DsrF family protein